MRALRVGLVAAIALVGAPAPAAPPTTKSIAPTTIPVMTSCREVAHVGDSTSVGLVSSSFLPDANDQLPARYKAVGVERFFDEISGARSMVEKFKDQPNATEVVKRRVASGYTGCWVLALGTNDPANTSGNTTMLGARIDAMMKVIGSSAPVLWTTTRTLKDKGPYQNEHMKSWNSALLAACARHPNMRVYDWAGESKDAWFLSDGIHPSGAGCRERAARFARALSRAFPKDGSPTQGCIVHADFAETK